MMTIREASRLSSELMQVCGNVGAGRKSCVEVAWKKSWNFPPKRSHA